MTLRTDQDEPPALLPGGFGVMLALSAALMLGMTIARIGASPFENWNAVRTAPVVAWAMGMPLYFPEDEGPATTFMYPPVSAILRLPVALTTGPTSAILVAELINIACYFLPPVVFLWTIRRRRARGHRLMLGIALLIGLGFTLTLQSLLYSAFFVHADAPAIGFALLGCACLMRRGRKGRGLKMMVLAGLCGVLSLGAKQTMAPVLLMLPVFALARHGWRGAGVLAAAELVLLVLGTWVMIRVFGYEPLRYSLVQIAARQPWFPEGVGMMACLMLWSGTLFAESAGPILGFGIFGRITGAIGGGGERRGGGRRRWIARNPWFLPLSLAIVMIPLALMGIAKRGAAHNSLTVVSYFLVVALAALVAGYRSRSREPWAMYQARATVGAAALLAIVLGILSACPFTDTRLLLKNLVDLRRNPQQVAFEFSQRHPQQAYFPRNTLSTLFSEGRLYITEAGLSDMVAVGENVTPQRIAAHLPPQMQLIAFPPPETAHYMQLAMFTQRVELPDLPGWIVYARGQP